MKILCKLCDRDIPDSFIDKLYHAMNYHPDLLMNRLARLPEISRSIGEMLGEAAKEKVYGNKNSLRNTTEKG